MVKRLVIFGASFNPPANHHIIIARRLIEEFDKVIIIPCGIRSDKPSTTAASPPHRKEMVKLAFSNIQNVEIDHYDLDNDTFTPTWMLDEKYKDKFPEYEIWHMTGGDLILMGRNGNSEIQRLWNKGERVWKNLNWAVIDHPDYPIDPRDLPPKNCLIKMDAFFGRSTLIRRRAARNESISDLVPSELEKYIKKNNLYK